MSTDAELKRLRGELRHICGELGEFREEGGNTAVEKIRFLYARLSLADGAISYLKDGLTMAASLMDAKRYTDAAAVIETLRAHDAGK